MSVPLLPLPKCVSLAVFALVLSLMRADAAPAASASTGTDASEIGKPLSAWSKGTLDIHHINTGRGDSLLFILPDSTTLLVDASDGQAKPMPAPFGMPTKPDSSRQAGEWIARYIAIALRNFPEKKIDYAVLSHFHGDHIGKATSKNKQSLAGDYRLVGISEVAEYLPIRKLIDRNWPDYNYPVPLNLDNYRKFLNWHIKHHSLVVERFKPGRNDQLVLRHNARAFPSFVVQNLMANGRVWTGEANNTRELADLAKGQHLNENECSIAFRLSYGKFDYFFGGDLDASNVVTPPGSETWRDVEPAVAKACGPVDVMKANHHGSWNANCPEFLHRLQPRVIVVTSRADGHPATNTFQQMLSKTLWKGPRDIFITNVTPATRATTYNIDQAKSLQGHVVIRVDSDGSKYRIFVLDDSNEEQRVKAVFGPYTAN